MTPYELERVDELYPNEPDKKAVYYNVSRLFTDYFFACPARRTAQAFVAHGLPVIKSIFKHQLAASKVVTRNLGVPHGLDIPFWWRFVEVMLPSERKLSKVMSKAMIEFGSCDDPYNCKVGTEFQSNAWPLYGDGTRTVLQIPATKLKTEPDAEWDSKCAYFEAVLDSKYGEIPSQAPPFGYALPLK
jgi:carboxylesterase type B